MSKACTLFNLFKAQVPTFYETCLSEETLTEPVERWMRCCMTNQRKGLRGSTRKRKLWKKLCVATVEEKLGMISTASSSAIKSISCKHLFPSPSSALASGHHIYLVTYEVFEVASWCRLQWFSRHWTKYSARCQLKLMDIAFLGSNISAVTIGLRRFKVWGFSPLAGFCLCFSYGKGTDYGNVLRQVLWWGLYTRIEWNERKTVQYLSNTWGDQRKAGHCTDGGFIRRILATGATQKNSNDKDQTFVAVTPCETNRKINAKKHHWSPPV